MVSLRRELAGVEVASKEAGMALSVALADVQAANLAAAQLPLLAKQLDVAKAKLKVTDDKAASEDVLERVRAAEAAATLSARMAAEAAVELQKQRATAGPLEMRVAVSAQRAHVVEVELEQVCAYAHTMRIVKQMCDGVCMGMVLCTPCTLSDAHCMAGFA